jgi:MinD-like ATPase involved in chromosome partitioning or flagellar assembly
VNHIPVISIVGTKGGVGKSTFSMGLTICFAKLRPEDWMLLVDGDMHIRSVELKMCPECDATLAEVFEGKPLEEAIYLCQLESEGKPLYPNLAVLPAGGRFLPPMRGDPLRFVEHTKQKFDEIIKKLRKRFAYITIDTPASMSFEHLILTAVADAVIYVAEPNDDSVEATIATAQGLKEFMDVRPLGSVLNRLPAGVSEKEWVRKLSAAAPVLGIVPDDLLVGDAFRRNMPVVALYPKSAAARAIENIARKILQLTIKPAAVPEKIERALEKTAGLMGK